MESDETATRAVYRHGPEDDRPINFIGDVFSIKAKTDATNGAYSLTEMIVSPKAKGPPPHHHEDCEEAFYIVSGQLDLEVDGEPVSAPAGTFVVVPRGSQHIYSNPLDEPSKVLVMISPPGFENEFERMGEFVK
jgi:mannose-6-phosphate isomerase-like protein (cupin superfamily)